LGVWPGVREIFSEEGEGEKRSLYYRERREANYLLGDEEHVFTHLRKGKAISCASTGVQEGKRWLEEKRRGRERKPTSPSKKRERRILSSKGAPVSVRRAVRFYSKKRKQLRELIPPNAEEKRKRRGRRDVWEVQHV